jgi:hypothetical protein
MTALSLRQALATIATSNTVDGTLDNPVSTLYFWTPDQIAFDATPALVVTSPDEEEKPLTLGVRTLGGSTAHTQITLKVDLEYLDAPLAGDDEQEAMAALEQWFETAKANLRLNRLGQISGTNNWLAVDRMHTIIDRPLRDAGRVMYQGCLSVWLRAIATPA